MILQAYYKTAKSQNCAQNAALAAILKALLKMIYDRNEPREIVAQWNDSNISVAIPTYKQFYTGVMLTELI